MINMDIIDVLEENFIDYAAPILCNNLPSIDGLLPVNRKVIWGMNEAKITPDKPFVKMLRASGFILPYYTFGDMPLASSMKNMGNNSINYTYLLPKGSFGDKRRKNAKGAAARYIECKLSEYSIDMLKGINKNAVSMKRNYDNTKDEPIIMPSIMPNILINTSQSIAVGESSKIPSHNLNEVCNSFIEYIKTKDIEKSINMLNGADFETCGQIINNRKEFEKIYKTGRGSFRLVGNYTYNEKDNSIIITEVPYEVHIETIESEVREGVENGDFKEVLDTHNSTDKDGIGLMLYLRKNTNVDNFIMKLRKYTSFEKALSCNFTILDLDGKTPVLMTLEDIINKWRLHRSSCIKNELLFDKNENLVKLNRLYGLSKINEDLDKTIQIIRSSKKEKDAIDSLMKEFNLNKEQCEYISTIRLVNINNEWINTQIKNIHELEQKNVQIENTINNESEIDNIIISQLEYCIKKYGRNRKTILLDMHQSSIIKEDILIEDYNLNIVLSKEGYLKKVKLTSLRGASEYKFKEGDSLLSLRQTSNKNDLLVFTNKQNCYKLKIHELADHKPSVLGLYLPSHLQLEEDETIIDVIPTNYTEELLIAYANGKVSRVPLVSYQTKQNRSKLSNATHTEKIVGIHIYEDTKYILATKDKALIFNSKDIPVKSSRTTQGITTMKHANMGEVIKFKRVSDCTIDTQSRYTGKKIGSAGKIIFHTDEI